MMLQTTSTIFMASLSQLMLLVGAQSQSTPGVYNTSKTPGTLPWNTYNYCNAPHVNAKHYQPPPEGGEKATLVYLNVMMRHHKVSCFQGLVDYEDGIDF